MTTTTFKYFIVHYTVKQRGKRTYIHALIWANFSLRESSPELATSSLEFEYLHRKSRCEMLIGRDDISYDVITLGTCFCFRFRFALIDGNLTAQSTGSNRGIGKGIQISTNSGDVVTSSPSFSHHAARAPRRVTPISRKNDIETKQKSSCT